VNDQGALIGINTAILSGGTGGNQGIGFAIPVNMARTVMERIMADGHVTRAWMGVMLQEVNPEIAKAFGLAKPSGALVGDVPSDGPAAHAGIKNGDILLSVDGKPVEGVNQLRLKISMMKPGTTVHLNLFRDGQEKDVAVTLGELPSDSERASNNGAGESGPTDGIEVDNLTPEISRELGLPPGTHGVVVSAVDGASSAAEAGLQRGDVIEEVNRKPVDNVTTFDQAMNKAGKDSVLLLVNHGGSTRFVVLEAS
jgi:serine protease Do